MMSVGHAHFEDFWSYLTQGNNGRGGWFDFRDGQNSHRSRSRQRVQPGRAQGEILHAEGRRLSQQVGGGVGKTAPSVVRTGEKRFTARFRYFEWNNVEGTANSSEYSSLLSNFSRIRSMDYVLFSQASGLLRE